MDREKSFLVKTHSALDRAIIISNYDEKIIPIQFTLSFSAYTTALSFVYDSRYKCIQEGRILVNMYRKITKSTFANKFLNVEYKDTDSEDYRAHFKGIKLEHKNKVYQFFGEHYNLNYNLNDPFTECESTLNTNTNELWISGFKLKNHTDVVYYFVERTRYNPMIDKYIIRTCAMQYSTLKGIDLINSI